MKALKSEFASTVAGGQGKLKGKIFRVAHLGYYDATDILGCSARSRSSCSRLGHAFELGAGVAAARPSTCAGRERGSELQDPRPRRHHRPRPGSAEGRGLAGGRQEGDAARRARRDRRALPRDHHPQQQPDHGRGARRREEPARHRPARRRRRQRRPGRRHAPRRHGHELAAAATWCRRPSWRSRCCWRSRATSPQADASIKAGKWDRKSFAGVELHGKRIGVVGFGRIGREVAARCRALGMEVVAYDPFVSPAVAEALHVVLVSLDELLQSLRLHHAAHDAVEGDAPPDRQGGAGEGQARRAHRERRARRADRRGGAPGGARVRARGGRGARRARAGAARRLEARPAPARGGDAARGRVDGRGAGARGHRHRVPGARLPEGRAHPARGQLLLADGRPLRPGPPGHGPGRAARPLLSQACDGAPERIELGLYGELRELDVQADPLGRGAGRARAAPGRRGDARQRAARWRPSTRSTWSRPPPRRRRLPEPDGAAPEDERAPTSRSRARSSAATTCAWWTSTAWTST